MAPMAAPIGIFVYRLSTSAVINRVDAATRERKLSSSPISACELCNTVGQDSHTTLLRWCAAQMARGVVAQEWLATMGLPTTGSL